VDVKACLKEHREGAPAASLAPSTASCTSSAAGGAAGGAQEEENVQMLEDQPKDPVVQNSMHGGVAAGGGGSHMNSTGWVARSLGPDLAPGEVADNDIRGAVGRAAASVGLGSHRKKLDLS
jgi:hypothetical protein